MKYVGLAYILASVFSFIISLVYWRSFKSTINVDIKDFESGKAKELFQMGGWLSLGRIGTLMLVSMDIYIFNLFFDLAISGSFGAITQLLNVLRVGVGLISGILIPVIIIHYSKGEFAEIADTVKASILLILYPISVLVSVLFIFSQEILTLWLGIQFAEYSLLLKLLTVSVLFSLPVNVLFAIFTAYNKVKTPGKLQFLFGIAHLLLSLIFIKFTNLSFYSIPISGIIIAFCKNIIIIPVYASKIMGLPVAEFLFPLVKGLCFFVTSILATWVISSLFSIQLLSHVIILTACLFIVQSLVVYIIDRSFFIRLKFLLK
ncbi:hypothetical protein [Pontibacter sp. BAB1700]|uniref:hypothetical protein n=1 Tax=Pontibacter sp. BAB1700 TaxID=1144253 RepID=UPI00058E55DB|nr:hypothetical protein [Pontibacter sp. BAB1700]